MQQWLNQLFSTPVGQWHATDIVGVLILGLLALGALATIGDFVRGMSSGGPGRMLGPGAGRPN
jgi:hypothetical protein